MRLSAFSCAASLNFVNERVKAAPTKVSEVIVNELSSTNQSASTVAPAAPVAL